MPRDLSAALGDPAAAPACYIGQPVAVAKDEAVLRVALGSDSLRACLRDPAAALAEDAALIRKLALLAERFRDL
jgi:hypothetical protein